MNAIEIRGISKEFQLHRQVPTTVRERFARRPHTQREMFWALRDINLEIGTGTSLALIGDNGSGKSTLLKLIAGIHRPTSGTIRTRGRLSALLELGAGFHPDLTGRENVFLNGTILGLRRKQIESRLDEIVAFAGVAEFLDSPIKFYSSGMLLRLAFAVAVNVEPEILLIDEILAVGDLEFQRKCMEYLYRLRRDGTTVVLVSHNLSMVRDLCEEALWLAHGDPILVGPVGDVADAYVNAVNERVADRMRVGGSSGALELDSGTVLGSGEIRVVSVELLRGGELVAAGLSGRPLTIRLNYRAEAVVEEADVLLSIHHESGAMVAQPRSRDATDPLRFVTGPGYVEFVMDELLLAPGLYELSTAISHQGHAFDWRAHRYELPVHASGHDVGGLVGLPGRWQIRAGSAEGSDA
ncbi:MAG: ABC transporter ATP-binding protein [Aeromicrobium sp.]